MTAIKVVVALAAPLVVGVGAGRLPHWTRGRRARAAGWVAAVLLTLYGAVLTAVGVLVLTDVITAPADANRRALAWHAFLWDPWFALWGAAFTVSLWFTRPNR